MHPIKENEALYQLANPMGGLKSGGLVMWWKESHVSSMAPKFQQQRDL